MVIPGGVVVLGVGVVPGGVGLPVLWGGELRRRPSRITVTCAGILGRGMWVAQAVITLSVDLSKCLRRVYSVLQGCRPGVGASRRVIRPTIDHLTIATEVVVSRS